MGYFFGNEGGHKGARKFLTICNQNSDNPINCYGLTGLAYEYAWIEEKFDFKSFFRGLSSLGLAENLAHEPHVLKSSARSSQAF